MIKTFSIREELTAECQKLIRRYGIRVAQARRQQKLFNKRTWLTPRKPTDGYAPAHWSIDDSFNPFYVRKRIPQFSNAISTKISNETYSPNPALHLDIPKPSGGTRTIAVFPVADAAVSRWLYRRLLAKNLHRISSYAFAYRHDRTTGNAIEHLRSFISTHPRLYLVEYDFRSYFDNISHDYLAKLLSSRISIGRKELAVAMSFIKSRHATKSQYSQSHFVRRTRGIAQGSSLSLFLANLACLELDDALEKEGVCYARYADDTVVLCRTYDQAARAAEVLHKHKFVAGTELNLQKSDGISLLTNEPSPELKSKPCFDFLGHEVGLDGISLACRTKRKIKEKISRIIHRHLLLYITNFDYISPRRIVNRTDWDLVTCINELRKYVSGSLTPEQISGDAPILFLNGRLGVVSFFSEVTNGSVFRELDGWLVSALRRAIAERRRRLWSRFRIQAPLICRQQIIDGSWYAEQEIDNNTTLPSFFSSWKAVRRFAIGKGPSRSLRPGYSYDF